MVDRITVCISQKLMLSFHRSILLVQVKTESIRWLPFSDHSFSSNNVTFLQKCEKDSEWFPIHWDVFLFKWHRFCSQLSLVGRTKTNIRTAFLPYLFFCFNNLVTHVFTFVSKGEQNLSGSVYHCVNHKVLCFSCNISQLNELWLHLYSNAHWQSTFLVQSGLINIRVKQKCKTCPRDNWRKYANSMQFGMSFFHAIILCWAGIGKKLMLPSLTHLRILCA